MHFIQVAPDDSYPLNHWQSENWDISYRPMMFGCKVSAGVRNNNWYTLDYCAGSENLFLQILFNLVKGMLEYLPEYTSEAIVRKFLPLDCEIKPIYKDALWQELFIIFNKLKSGTDWKDIHKTDIKTLQSGNILDFYLMSQDVPIGYLKSVQREKYWLIEDISIDLSLQKQGYGTYLLQKSCQLMWQKDFKNCRIAKCPEDFLYDWFEKMGFISKGWCFERIAGDYNYGLARIFNWK